MKRKLAVILTVFMLVTVLSPLQGFASGDDKGLESAIKTAKSFFDIPEDYKLISSFRSEGDKKVWDLNWNSKDDMGGSIGVRIDENGTVLWYNSYKHEYYQESQKKFPKVSKQEAKAKADRFIKRVNPSAVSSIKYNDDNRNSLMDNAYYFTYTRMVNNVPYYENSIRVTVNSNTGDIMNYNYNWTDGLTFPDASKAILVEKAQEAYSEKMGLKLIYQSARVKDELKVFAIYVPKYNNYSYAIDAITGEKIDVGTYYGPYGGATANDMAMEMAKKDAGGMGDGGVTLSPEEEKEVKEISGLISLEEAEKIARDSSAVGLDKELKLEHYNLSRNWEDRDEISWYLNFLKEPNKDSKEEYRHASVRIDAKTGEIKFFYMNTPYNAEEKAKDDEAAAKAAVKKFLKEFKPDKFDAVELDEDIRDNVIIMKDSELPRSYWFYFTRKVNGIQFPGNGFSIGYDAVRQKVTDFNMNWYNIKFPSIDKAISVDRVNEILFNQVGLELQYKGVYTENMIDVEISRTKPEMKLVYALKPDKPLSFDAFTGDIVNYDGTPYKEYKPAEYTDIEGHFAEKQIKMLAEYGVALEGTEFKPGEQIKQKEFFTLLTKTINYYYGPILRAESTKEDIDNMYNFLIREKIITAAEKKPEESVKREDAVKYIIKALKYNEVAEIKGIYNCSFKDADKIDPDLVGYVTIAYGMKIINGANGYVNPKGIMTRGEAAVVIYNYLQR